MNFWMRSLRQSATYTMAVLVQGNAPGHIQLPRAIAEATELAQIAAIQGELLHSMIAAIDQEHGPIVADGQPCRAVQLPISRTWLAPFAQKLAVFGEDGDAVQPLVGDIDIPLGCPAAMAVGQTNSTVIFAVGAELTDVLSR